MSEPIKPGTPDPRDFLGIDALLDGEERLLRDTVRQFVADRVLPDVADWFEAGVFPKEMAREMGALGLLGMHLEGYGCAGTSSVQYGLACLELEAGDSGARSFASVQGSLAMYPIWAFGSEEQKQEWLPRMAAGDLIGCFGLTEADSGSDPSSMRTTARRDGGDWVLNGSKMWITNGGIADVAVVWAQTDEGVRGFVVPTETPGFATNDIHQKLSLRASVTSELVLSDVRLPGDAVLPNVVGMKGPLSCLNEARFGILFGVIGAARACYESALDYSKERTQFDKPIASFQLTQRKLVDMMVGINRGMLVALHLGRKKDAGTLDAAQISFGKLDNVRMALDVARSARSVLGANGITLEYPVIRHMNNLESVFTYEGTNEIHTLILGQAITGESAFRSRIVSRFPFPVSREESAVRFPNGVTWLLVVVAIGVAGCGGGSNGSAVPVVDEAAIYGDLVVRLCDQARCGPSHPAFVLLASDTAEARAGVSNSVPDVVFIASTDGLIGPDDQVIEGGRILRLGALRLQPSKEIVLIDTFWESSPFEGKGETYVYQWDGNAWANVEPSTVGITVTTAVP